MLTRCAAFIVNALWLLACLPAWVRFVIALRNPRRAQEWVLRRLLRHHRDSVFGRRHGFEAMRTPADFAARVPLADYDSFAADIDAVRQGTPFTLAAAPVRLLEPTSGTSGPSKLIPLTDQLLGEFQAAIRPWLAWLYLAHPRLLLGRQYWAVSPNTPLSQAAHDACAVRVGFAADADYLGTAGRLLLSRLLVAPSELRLVADREAFCHLTLLFLLREPNLRLISVWHPSFLTILLDALPAHLPAILRELDAGTLDTALRLAPETRVRIQAQFRPDAKRAAQLATLDLLAHPERACSIWPALTVISCWTGMQSEPWTHRLQCLFPGVTIQGKGLLATEGVVTIPTGCGQLHPCAIRSHYLEFIEPDTGTVRGVHELQAGRQYEVVLSTGGGLWRYRLHDRVGVDGFCRATPSLTFVGKGDSISDLVGEKLSEPHVAQAVATAAAATEIYPLFSMLVPDAVRGVPGYLLLLELPHSCTARAMLAARLTDAIENELRRNYHYAHARNLGQLQPLRSVIIKDGAKTYRLMRETEGARTGPLKLPLLLPRRAPWWEVDEPRQRSAPMPQLQRGDPPSETGEYPV